MKINIMNKCLILIASMLIAFCTYGQTTNMVWAKNIVATTTSHEGIAQEIVMDNVGNYYIAGYYRGNLDMDPGPLQGGSRTSKRPMLFRYLQG